MQNRRNSYNPPPADFTLAVDFYLKTLQKLRLPNSLTNQLISAKEFMENVKQAKRKRDWLNSYLNHLKQSQLEAVTLLEEVKLEYEKMLKFAQNNPITMTTGAELKEWDFSIELERKKVMQELEKIIKELEKRILVLSERQRALTTEIATLRKEIDNLEEKAYEAASNLYISPKDPDESTKINLANITALKPFLPEDKSKHILNINHRAIIDKVKKKLRKNPKNINKNRLDDDMHQAIQERVQESIDEHFENHFPNTPPDQRDEVVSQIKAHAYEMRTAVQIHINPEHALFIESAEKEIKQKEKDSAEAANELEYINDALHIWKKELEEYNSQHDFVFHVRVEPLNRSESDEKIIPTPQQEKKARAFIERQSASSNLNALEKSPKKSPSEKKEAKSRETKKMDLSSSFTSERSSPKKVAEETKEPSSQLQERGFFSTRTAQQTKTPENASAVTLHTQKTGEETSPNQNKKPREKKPIPR